jgi:hypothetical protein
MEMLAESRSARHILANTGTYKHVLPHTGTYWHILANTLTDQRNAKEQPDHRDRENIGILRSLKMGMVVKQEELKDGDGSETGGAQRWG